MAEEPRTPPETQAAPAARPTAAAGRAAAPAVEVPRGMSYEARRAWALILPALIGLIAMLYWAYEPARMQAAAERQRRVEIQRGAHTFAQYCTPCHGISGQGGAGQNGGYAPALNSATYKATDDPKIHTHPADTPEYKHTIDFLTKTIARGRAIKLPQNPADPNSPLVDVQVMPKWGDTEGGPLNQQQILEVALFIAYGTDEDWEHMSAQATPVPVPTPLPVPRFADLPPGDARRGEALFRGGAQPPCISCHIFGQTAAAPDLQRNAPEWDRRKPGMSAQEYLLESIWNPNAYIVQGYQPNIMPQIYSRQLTPQQIADLIAYLMTLRGGA